MTNRPASHSTIGGHRPPLAAVDLVGPAPDRNRIRGRRLKSASSSAVDGGGEERSPIGGSARDGPQSPREEFRPKNLSVPAGRLPSFQPTPQGLPFYTSLTALSFSADDEPRRRRVKLRGSISVARSQS